MPVPRRQVVAHAWYLYYLGVGNRVGDEATCSGWNNRIRETVDEKGRGGNPTNGLQAISRGP